MAFFLFFSLLNKSQVKKECCDIFLYCLKTIKTTAPAIC